MQNAAAVAVERSHPVPGPAGETEVLLRALVAGYALMAHADGELAGSERRRLLAMIRDTPSFEAFPADDVADAIAACEAHFRRDPEGAQRAAWADLDGVAGQRRAAHVLVGACRELIAADGVAHPAEYRTLAAIRSRLGIDGLPPHA